MTAEMAGAYRCHWRVLLLMNGRINFPARLPTLSKQAGNMAFSNERTGVMCTPALHQRQLFLFKWTLLIGLPARLF